MKRLVEIVPARPGWYARWRTAPEATCSYPVTVWALVEESDETNREVIGVDAAGQWPGSDDDDLVGEFVRYVFQPPDSGEPEDLERAGQPADQRAGQPADQTVSSG
ncbi:hypothetical protein [Micromonospora zhanjiangensis]|uniref:Uncharacterized protein n=1 Tax=Micromonospora zhanjiangensis TaxID=1522057 RepID=A0ABV8KTD5_9ACTN